MTVNNTVTIPMNNQVLKNKPKEETIKHTIKDTN